MTAEGAKRYGVVINAKGLLDAAATDALRKEIAARRGPKKIFDRGFDTIEELKARCLEETGLPPPQPPRFTKWAKVAAEAMARSAKKSAKAA